MLNPLLQCLLSKNYFIANKKNDEPVHLLLVEFDLMIRNGNQELHVVHIPIHLDTKLSAESTN